MPLKQVIVGGDIPSFINGTLMPPGSVTSVDTDALGVDDLDHPSVSNLTALGKTGAPAPIPYEVASINPTGPNPTMPQSLPPGAIQIGETYLAPGVDGGPAVQPVAEGSKDDGEVTRRGK